MVEQDILVTLCWSLGPRHVQEMRLQVPNGSTVAFVLEQGVAQSLKSQGSTDDVSLSSLQFQQPGIWGKPVPWNQVVQADDRIELYRPLKVDPKVARRQRFKRQGKGRTGLFANRKSGSAAGY
ncbi:RnfH family protein [Limnohabitans sp. Rim8]|uniref:RnfH family protein n=1 Tax=Limnohabitans sp. Rim8 TaxID=1100718 RepID=UPI00263735E1|nr:RnfH family protein [Limnohabitans sp. Rim8]